MNKDTIGTIAGGAAGLLLLQTVQWQTVWGGETTKVAVALVLALLGYLIYKNGKPPATQ